jgi:AcrR family transcriptional regulator
MEKRSMARNRRVVVPRIEQVARNRGQLLAAARHVFGELGYAGASLDEIAERAGFTKGAVYSHFRSKADLFLSLLEERIEQRAAGQRAMASHPMSPAAIAEFVREVTSQSRSDPPWRLAVIEFRVVAARDPELNARYATAHRNALDELAETIRTLFAELGTEPNLPTEQLAFIAFALDSGGFLEDTAITGAMSTDDVAALFSQLAGLPTDPNEVNHDTRRSPNERTRRATR